jgi:hypothetical protein
MADLTTTDALVEGFLARAAAAPPPRGKRIIFAVDATGSRQPTWDLAAKAQAEMFEAAARHGGLEIQLVYFQGHNTFRKTDWLAASAPLIGAMSKVLCRVGPTQIGRVLAHAADERRKGPLAAMILVGDTSEEPLFQLEASARQLSDLEVPIYCFLEGDCPDGRAAFSMIARVTGGALLPFDSGAAARLRELLGAVAALVTGGAAALADQRPEVVALLTGGQAR